MYKAAGKKDSRVATGLNYRFTEEFLKGELNREPTREEVKARIGDIGPISPEQIAAIYEIELPVKLGKIFNKNEKAAFVIGMVLSGEEQSLGELKDYLLSSESEIKKPGDYFKVLSVEIPPNIEEIKKAFGLVNRMQKRWHTEAAKAQSKIDSERVDYKTNQIVHQFEDGWKVVYVPAAGEMEEYPGLPNTSHDRIHEGNIMGLCMGSGRKYYQDNLEGKVYSVRDAANNPKATIRIEEEFSEDPHEEGMDEYLEEVKGKGNSIPNFEISKHVKEWLHQKSGLDYESNSDYKSMPPTTVDEAESLLVLKPTKFFMQGFASFWYKKGIPFIDEEIDKSIKAKKSFILHSGLHKKHKNVIAPVFHYWRNKFFEKESDTLFIGWMDVGYANPEFGIWRGFADEPETKKAAALFAEKNPNNAIRVGVHNIYKDIMDKHIDKLIGFDPVGFFEDQFEDYSSGVEKVYPKKGLIAARRLIWLISNKKATYNESILDYDLPNKYPEVAREFGELIAKYDPSVFFKKERADALKNIPVEIKKIAAKTIANGTSRGEALLFFSFQLDKPYPELGLVAAKNIAEVDPTAFFDRAYKISEKYTEYAEIAAARMFKTSKYTYLLLSEDLKNRHPEINKYIRQAAIEYAKRQPSSILTDRFVSSKSSFIKKYYPEIKQLILKEHLNPYYVFVGYFEVANEETRRVAAEKISLVNPALIQNLLDDLMESKNLGPYRYLENFIKVRNPALYDSLDFGQGKAISQELSEQEKVEALASFLQKNNFKKEAIFVRRLISK